MKSKTLIAVIIGLSLFAGTANAQTVDQAKRESYRQTLIALIAALQAQLDALLAPQQPSSTLPTQSVVSSPTNAVGAAVGAEGDIVTSTLALKTISVTSSTDRITITNTSDVSIRVKGMALASGTIASVIRGDWVYPAIKLTCSGPKTLGMYNDYDLCMRRDANEPINELAPGESFSLRITDGTPDFTYQPGTIVEVATGNNVTY